ncbi:MAG TPA: flagellar protein FlgN [Steroidobacteraceae bacterium]|nr:flagellar protein FlgN [Steroidobacteraceae bacterium]
MDPLLCRDNMSRLISEESGGLAQLAELLEREHGLLMAGDVVHLQAAINERQRCVGRIARVDEERRAMCRARNLPLNAQGLEALLRWCDPEGILSSRWAECAAVANRCRQLNDRNGALVSTQLQHVRTRLGTLLKNGRETLTYRPNGEYSQGTVGRMLTTEA